MMHPLKKRGPFGMTSANRNKNELVPELRWKDLLSCQWGARGAVFLALIHLSVLWMSCYPQDDLDDKAVHYYCAARLYTDHVHAEAIAKALPAWLSQLDTARQRFRTDNRVSIYANYVIPSSLVRLIAQIDRPSDQSPPRSYTRPLKIAFLLLHVFGLFWIFAVTWRRPFVSVFLFACLTIASFRISLSWITQCPPEDMLFLIYVPRGSAVLLFVGAFAAFQQRKRLIGGISLLLLFGWHFGSSALIVPLAVLSYSLTRAAQLRSRWTRIGIVGVLTLLGGTLTTFVTPSPLLTRLWIPLLVVCLLMLAGRAISHNPFVTAVTLAATYLLLAQTATILLANPRMTGWLCAATGNALAAELPMRLTGSMQVAAIALVLATGVGSLNAVAVRWISVSWQKRVFLVAALVLFIYAVYAHRDKERRLWTARCAFFQVDDAQVVRQQPTSKTLDKLDPRYEASFFASLGDFILCPIDGSQNANQPMQAPAQ